MRLSVSLGIVHKWIGIVIGIQVVLWVAGGVVMSAFPIELVRGETNIAAQTPRPITENELGIRMIDLLASTDPIAHIGTSRVAGNLHFVLTDLDGRRTLIDASSGAHVDVDAALARRVAELDFAGSGAVSAIALKTERSAEYRGDVPAWKVTFDDSLATTIYVSPADGRITARRNNVWRLYDFFWMLHIMDYRDRSNFNHPLLISAAGIALLLALSGFALLFYRVRASDLRRLFGRR
jgi:hypothetical protein